MKKASIGEHGTIEKNEAQAMADFIERWLDNSWVRRLLRFCTARDKCGSRMENALGTFIGEKRDICIKCSMASVMTRKFLNIVMNKTNADRGEIKSYLKDPMWRKGLTSVLEGIGEWGTRKPFTSYAPFLVVWNVTRTCNLKCKHCYAFAGTKDPNELNTEEALEAVDKMAAAGVAYIALSGGEPLIRPDIFQIIDRIKKNNMAFSIATNAVMLTKEKAQKLKDLGCLYVQVSLDGARPETHNWFRGRNAFELTTKSIKTAAELGLHVGISTTVTQHNYDEVLDIVDLSEKLGAKTFMYYNFIPTGRGEEIVNLDISPEQREELLKKLASETKKRKISLLSTACQYSRVCIENDAATMAMTHFDNSGIKGNNPLTSLAEFVGGCGTGRLYCALDYDGSITPCVFIQIKLGNIRTDDLLEVWHNSEVFEKIRDRESFSGVCGTCKYRNVCGGCRARAYGYYKDLQASDVGCILNKEEWKKLKSPVAVEHKK